MSQRILVTLPNNQGQVLVEDFADSEPFVSYRPGTHPSVAWLPIRLAGGDCLVEDDQ